MKQYENTLQRKLGNDVDCTYSEVSYKKSLSAKLVFYRPFNIYIYVGIDTASNQETILIVVNPSKQDVFL